MRRLLTAAGVDYDQWRALTIVALKLDYRQTSFGQAQPGRHHRGASLIIGQLVFYTMFGVAMALAAWFIRDLFLAGTTLMTYVMFIVGTVVLLDHNSALTSPVDYPVLGHRPIASRTYFAARLANVFVYTTVITTVAVYLPVFVLFFKYGPAIGLAGLMALYLCSISTALALLFAYATMLKWFGANAIRRALSYVQLAMSFLVYGGYFALSRVVSESVVTSATLPKTWLVLLLPPAWFASYLELAAGRSGLTELVPVVISLAALAAMASSLGGRLSLEYSERLGALASAGTGPPTRAAGRRGSSWFRSGEGRSMALLIRSQFKNDQRFRMAVLAILPLTLVYVLMGVNDGSVNDPFVRSEDGGGLSLVTFAVLMFPTMLRTSLTQSDAFRASWVFFACPANRAALIRAAKNVLTVYFLLPYLMFVTAIYAYLVPNVLHVVVHMSLVGLISHLALQGAFLIDPDLPFARPPTKGRSSRSLFGVIFAIAFVAIGLQVLGPTIYARPSWTAMAYVVVLTCSVFVELLTRARVEGQARALEFQG